MALPLLLGRVLPLLLLVRLAEEARLKLEMGRLLRRPEASDEEYRLVEPLLLLLPLPLKPVLLELLLARPLF